MTPYEEYERDRTESALCKPDWDRLDPFPENDGQTSLAGEILCDIAEGLFELLLDMLFGG